MTKTEMPSPPVTQAAAHGGLILVAEDDPLNRKLIQQQFRLLGREATIVESGREALKQWREGRCALLFTDLHMPEMGGFDLIAAIRSEETGKRTPIFALTASAPQLEAERALAAGADGYLTKPMNIGDLQAILERWLPLPGRPASADIDVVDVAVLKRVVGADDATVREFLADYLASAQHQAVELQTALAVGDIDGVGNIAHKLKSSSHAVGALRLGDLCADLEDSCRVLNGGAIAEQVRQFNIALAAVEQELIRFLAMK